jgi:hypothetical protein
MLVDHHANAGASARAVAVPASPASTPSSQPTGIAISATAAPAISAGWTGDWQAVSGERDLPRWLALSQQGAKLTVVVAPGSAAHFLLLHAQTSGNSISFAIQDGPRTLLYDLKAENNELRGAVSITTPTQTKTVAVRFERSN